MTHRDRAGDASGQWAGRREAAGDAGHRQGFPTPSRAPATGSPARPERRFPKAFGRRRARLPMSRIATPRACSPKTLGSRLYGSLSALLGISAEACSPSRRRTVYQPFNRQIGPTSPGDSHAMSGIRPELPSTAEIGTVFGSLERLFSEIFA